jgi:hypothetical protein
MTAFPYLCDSNENLWKRNYRNISNAIKNRLAP